MVTTAILSTSTISYAQILIGQVAGFTGIVSDGVKDISYGAKLYIDSINAQGGINGQKIEIIQADDGFDANRTVVEAQKMIEERNVSALFLTRGTAQSESLLPLLEKYKIALIAPSTGAITLRKPVLRYVFNVRPTYQAEAEKTVLHYANIGMNRIAAIYAADSFGKDAIQGVESGLAKIQSKATSVEAVPKDTPEFTSIAKRTIDSSPQVVFVIASGKVAQETIKALKATAYQTQIVALSNNATSGFAKAVDSGTVVSQVFPQNSAMTKEASALAKASGYTDSLSPAIIEGFASAKALVEGLRKAGPKPTREKIRTAFESIDKYDLGGISLSYSPTDHNGFSFSELSVVSKGRFVR